MADDEPDDDGADKKKRKFNPKLIGIVVVVLGAAGYFFLGCGGGSAEAGATATTIAIEDEPDGLILPVGSLTVNLQGDGIRFGRIAFALVLVEGVDPLTVEGKFPLLLDAALSELAAFTADDLLELSGQEKLRAVLTGHARDLLNVDDERVVKRVVLTDLLVQ